MLHHSQLAVGAGSPTDLKVANRLNKPAPTTKKALTDIGAKHLSLIEMIQCERPTRE